MTIRSFTQITQKTNERIPNPASFTRYHIYSMFHLTCVFCVLYIFSFLSLIIHSVLFLLSSNSFIRFHRRISMILFWITSIHSLSIPSIPSQVLSLSTHPLLDLFPLILYWISFHSFFIGSLSIHSLLDLFPFILYWISFYSSFIGSLPFILYWISSSHPLLDLFQSSFIGSLYIHPLLDLFPFILYWISSSHP